VALLFYLVLTLQYQATVPAQLPSELTITEAVTDAVQHTGAAVEAERAQWGWHRPTMCS